MQKLTESMEQYLDAIRRLGRDGQAVRVSDLATEMGVSKASASNAVKTLQAEGCVLRTADRKILLTEEGHEEAERLTEASEMIWQFLVDILGVDEETAAQDAAALSHIMQPVTVESFVQLL